MKQKLIISLILFIHISAFAQQNITGSSGSFGLTSQQYINDYQIQYNINIGSQSSVQLDVTIDVEQDWDMLYVYECDNNFSNPICVKTISGNTSVTYVSMSTNGKLIVKFVSDAGTCGANGFDGFTVNYGSASLSSQTIPSNNNISTTSQVRIGEVENAPNLHIIDRSSKNLGGLNKPNNFNSSMILLESEHNSKLALTYNKISSNDLMEVNADENLLFNTKSYNINADYFSLSTSVAKNALSVSPGGIVGINGGLSLKGNVITKLNSWIGVSPEKPYSTGTVRIVMHSEGKHAYIDFKDNLNFRADNPSVSPVIIQGDGNVAIGYSTSYATNGSQYRTEGYKLAIKGSTLMKGDLKTEGIIKAEEILVEAAGNTADFVFEPNYNLKSLSEVENFILTNKHLPDIPSAKEMEAQGVNLAEMNKLLLQKVEELTLYQIEKDKELKRQKLKVESLEKAKKKEQEEWNREKVEREKMEARLAKLEKLLLNDQQ